MSTRISAFLLAVAASISMGPMALAETVELRSGAVFVGDVHSVTSEAVVMDVRFPEGRTVTLKPEDLAPISLYRLMEARADRRSGEDRLRLGEFAEQAGLWGVAISDYMAVKQLTPGSSADMDRRVARLSDRIAVGILEDARLELAAGRANSALIYLHTILELHPTSAAAKEARQLVKTAHHAAGASAEVGEKTVSPEKAKAVADRVAKELDKGDREFKPVSGHADHSTRSQRSVERAIRHYEDAWQAVKTLPIVPRAGDLPSRFAALRGQAKSKLVNAYLTAGSIHLQRRSIPAAERYCNLACELDPEGKPNHALHRLIIQAKTYDGSWWGSQ